MKLIMMPFVGRKKKTQVRILYDQIGIMISNSGCDEPSVQVAGFQPGVATSTNDERVVLRDYVFPTLSRMDFLLSFHRYSSSMPILLFIGALYCLVAYWADKTCLLRYVPLFE